MNKQSQTGAALLMALLLISLLSLASLAIGGILVSDIKLTGAFRDKEEAYWAAEAGIEKGLLYYRLNEEEPEFPADTNQNNDLIYQRNNLSTGSTVVVSDPISPESDQSVADWRIYDQKIWNDQEFILDKDSGLTFRVPDNCGSSPCSLKIDDFRLISPTSSRLLPISDDTRVYVRRNLEDNNFDTEEYKRLELPQIINLQNTKSVQIKIFIARDDRRRGKKAELSITGRIGGPYVYIDSIGYYRDSTKRLMVKINRDSSSVFDILDYVIYSRVNLPKE